MSRIPRVSIHHSAFLVWVQASNLATTELQLPQKVAFPYKSPRLLQHEVQSLAVTDMVMEFLPGFRVWVCSTSLGLGLGFAIRHVLVVRQHRRPT